MAAGTSTGGSAATVRPGDVIAFRLHAHHLTNRQPANELHQVAGACGIQNNPPGSALLALHARVEEVTQERIDHHVGQDQSLLQTWCMRGAPFLFPHSGRTGLHHRRPAGDRVGATAADRRHRAGAG